MGLVPCTPAMGLVAPFAELKNRKKLEPTSTARPAISAASMAATDVIPLLASGAGQSLRCMISTGLTSHQIAPVVTKLSSTTWLWFGVGTNKGAFGRVGALRLDARLGLPGFGNVTEQTDQRVPQLHAAKFVGPSAVRAPHCMFRVSIFSEHRHQHVEVCGIIEATAGGVLCGFGDCLANRRLHLIRVGLRLDAVEVQIHGRLVDAVKVLQVAECDQPAVTKAVG